MDLFRTEKIICIDPGTTHSGVVFFDGKDVFAHWKDFENQALCDMLEAQKECKAMAIEGIASYGMAVGKTTFETVEWIGRFRQAFGFDFTTRIFRKDVKMFLCCTPRAKDTNIRQRVLDIFPASGGGKTPQIGTKKHPGPLYGITSHCMSALAVGLTYKYGLHT